jgi:hypothetical protein
MNAEPASIPIPVENRSKPDPLGPFPYHFWEFGWIEDPDTWYAIELRRLRDRAPA